MVSAVFATVAEACLNASMGSIILTADRTLKMYGMKLNNVDSKISRQQFEMTCCERVMWKKKEWEERRKEEKSGAMANCCYRGCKMLFPSFRRLGVHYTPHESSPSPATANTRTVRVF